MKEMIKNKLNIYMAKPTVDIINDVNLSDNEKVEIVGRKILKKYYKAFEKLAKM